MKTSRRKFITSSMLATAGIAGLNSYSNPNERTGYTEGSHNAVPPKINDEFSISIFSKHLQWLELREMSKVAKDMGFDGVDLTVRPGGHVLPEKVEEDLPKAFEIVTKAGLKMPAITTSVYDAEDPVSEKVLKSASSLGIRHYRMGYGHYENSKTVEANIAEVHRKLAQLAKLNEKYSISGEYQNHSGNYDSGIYFGGPVWDIIEALKKINSPWLGAQYDIYHATVEGANAWPIGMELISPYIRSIDIKDFQWVKKDGKWSSEPVPLGEGMVDYKKYLGLLKKFKITCPVSIHYEYPLGGAEHGGNTLTIKRETVIAAMNKDLVTLRKYMKEAGLV